MCSVLSMLVRHESTTAMGAHLDVTICECLMLLIRCVQLFCSFLFLSIFIVSFCQRPKRYRHDVDGPEHISPHLAVACRRTSCLEIEWKCMCPHCVDSAVSLKMSYSRRDPISLSQGPFLEPSEFVLLGPVPSTYLYLRDSECGARASLYRAITKGRPGCGVQRGALLSQRTAALLRRPPRDSKVGMYYAGKPGMPRRHGACRLGQKTRSLA
ncbi:hypothetical protein B0H19DRAFT_410345 [Mycena capillaripes]|nr:hypothetical protein B0H19DRAFT_410345 [Mycena capillaripes]